MLTERRLAILTDPAIRTALRAAIETVRAKRPFRIDSWVSLPDHLRTIWALPDGDADFSTRLRLIKSHVTHTCGAAYFRSDRRTDRHAHKACGTRWQYGHREATANPPAT